MNTSSTPPSSLATSPSSIAALEGVAHPRTVRSFVRRAGRVTTGQARARELFGERFLIPFAAQPLDLERAFGRAGDVVLEIGFGMGDATAQIAQARTADNFLCCEVHTAGVGALLKRVGDEGIANIRIIEHDAVEVLAHMLQPATLAGIHIFFPDPWHKKKHNKRRLIQPPLVSVLAQKLRSGGYLHCATDWQEYAQQMLEVLSAEPLLTNTAAQGDGGYVPRPSYRPLTKFERRGQRLGHGVWDLVFQRRAD